MALAHLAGRQHGVVTVAQLRSAGLGDSAVSKRVSAGRLHRVRRGVYAVGHTSLSEEGRWLAAVLWAGEGAALSHTSAARLFQIWRRRPSMIDVLAPRRRTSPAGVRLHRTRHLDPRDITHWRGIPVTPVARTLVDLTDELTEYQLANVIHEAAFRGRFSERATRDAMARANGRRALDRLARALDAHASGSAGTRSGLEDRFLELVEAAGLPTPIVNTEVAGIEVDFHWPDLRLCVEVDGPGHRRPRTRAEDRQKAAKLRAAGQHVKRLTEEELKPRQGPGRNPLLDALAFRTPGPGRA